mmetsp:Transcript_15165/g.37719  ORF Transcript_15165/g.37719 Transcript_15165/m.37719 type:complete len:207 (-) Transcript_15165:49-669(-)
MPSPSAGLFSAVLFFSCCRSAACRRLSTVRRHALSMHTSNTQAPIPNTQCSQLPYKFALTGLAVTRSGLMALVVSRISPLAPSSSWSWIKLSAAFVPVLLRRGSRSCFRSEGFVFLSGSLPAASAPSVVLGGTSGFVRESSKAGFHAAVWCRRFSREAAIPNTSGKGAQRTGRSIFVRIDGSRRASILFCRWLRRSTPININLLSC